ncbi:MAG: helix-turn-helix domain-containing protein [Pirellulales bacterium]|nr:helix-turn-helix domain-containing protein [Pirellulales bacterium]
MTTSTRYLTPPAIAKILGVTPERVICWIKSGKLRAFNLSEGTKRPRYRVAPDDLEDCLRACEVEATPRPRRRKQQKRYEYY